MSEFRVVFTATAEKELKRLPTKFRVKILDLAEDLRSDPFSGKKLHGEWAGYYAMRAWPYRILYSIDRGTVTVTIVTVAHRQSVYK